MTLLSEADLADIALVFYREGDAWAAHELPDVAYRFVAELESELRRFPDDADALAMLSLYDDFVVLARLDEDDELRVVLSDITAAFNWQLARSAADHLGVAVEGEDEDDMEQVPAGDLRMLADLGVGADVLSELFLDPEMYPEEIMAEIADRLGFGELFDELVDDDDDEDEDEEEDDDA